MSHRPLIKIMKCDSGHLVVTGVLSALRLGCRLPCTSEIGFQILLVELCVFGTPLPKHWHAAFTQLLDDYVSSRLAFSRRAKLRPRNGPVLSSQLRNAIGSALAITSQNDSVRA
jgi:hypothetical protein